VHQGTAQKLVDQKKVPGLIDQPSSDTMLITDDVSALEVLETKMGLTSDMKDKYGVPELKQPVL
jgi:hypothetical protein